VRLDRRRLDDQLRGDLGVRQPAREQQEDLALAGGELVVAARRRRLGLDRLGEALDQSARDRRRQ
jgi:hypothetical protein